MTKVQKRIQEAYGACYRLCESSRNAEQWLTRSLDAARRGEKQHRKIPNRYKLPVADAARYFAVKWFLDLSKAPTSYADCCSLREDCLFAYGARDELTGDKLCKDWVKLRSEYADVLALDYVSEFTR